MRGKWFLGQKSTFLLQYLEWPLGSLEAQQSAHIESDSMWYTHSGPVLCSSPSGLVLWTTSRANRWHSSQNLDQRTQCKQSCEREREKCPTCLLPCSKVKTVSDKIICMHVLNPPLRMAGEPVTQNGYPVDRSTAVEMDLQLISSSAIVYLGFSTAILSEVWKNNSLWKNKTKTMTSLTFPT